MALVVPGSLGARLRRWLFAVLLIGLGGAAVELILLEHYEDTAQLIPLGLIALAAFVLIWDMFSSTTMSRRVTQTTMGLFLAAGVVGIGLHLNGAAAFQREIDPEMDGWTLTKKIFHAKAPPALAPGLMIQLGLVGFAFTFTKEQPS